MDQIKKQLLESKAVLEAFIASDKEIRSIEFAGNLMVQALSAGRKIISCGNGGSMSDAMHFAEELAGRFRENRKSLPAIAISDPSYLTCTANDFGYVEVFSRYVEGVGNKGDVLLAISTSGNSPNIIKAIQAASKKGMLVIGLTGKNGGRMAELCDVEIRAPKTEYSDRAQEIHIKVIHILVDYIERNLKS